MKLPKRHILITGATGNIGRHVAAALPEARRLSRSSAPGFVRGDLAVPESLNSCLDGIDTVFLVWTAPRDSFPAAWEKIASRVRRVVYLSAPLKTPHPFFQQPNPGRELAEQIEQTIESSGLEWTFLRPGMFAGNALHFWGPQIRAGAKVRWPYLDVATAPTDERDIAEVAVRALSEDGHDRAEYVITGPESLTQREQIEIIGHSIGRTLEIEELPPGESRLPRFLLDAWKAAAGRAAFVSPAFHELMGWQPRSFAQWATDHAKEFQA